MATRFRDSFVFGTLLFANLDQQIARQDGSGSERIGIHELMVVVRIEWHFWGAVMTLAQCSTGKLFVISDSDHTINTRFRVVFYS